MGLGCGSLAFWQIDIDHKTSRKDNHCATKINLAEKVKKCVFRGLILCCNNASGNKSYTAGKPVYFPLNVTILWRCMVLPNVTETPVC